jgi:hypothetical protein
LGTTMYTQRLAKSSCSLMLLATGTYHASDNVCYIYIYIYIYMYMYIYIYIYIYMYIYIYLYIYI